MDSESLQRLCFTLSHFIIDENITPGQWLFRKLMIGSLDNDNDVYLFETGDIIAYPNDIDSPENKTVFICISQIYEFFEYSNPLSRNGTKRFHVSCWQFL